MDESNNPSAAGSPQQDPAVSASTAPVSVRPIRSSLREFSFTLPCGILFEDKIYNEVVLRTVTAGDRRLFGDEKLQKSPGKLTTAIIHSKLSAIPGFRYTPSETIVRQMLNFDRNAILYALRKETTRERPFEESFACSHCSIKNTVDIPLEEIESSLKVMPKEVRLETHNGCVKFEVNIPEFGFRGLFLYPDGRLQERLDKNSDTENPFESEFEALAEMCLDFNGEGKPTAKSLQDLDVDFLDTLQNVIRDRYYGYEFSPPQTCHACGKNTRVRASVLDFLFDGLRKRIQSNP